MCCSVPWIMMMSPSAQDKTAATGAHTCTWEAVNGRKPTETDRFHWDTTFGCTCVQIAT